MNFGTDAQWEYGLGQKSEKRTEEVFKLSEPVFLSRGFTETFPVRADFFDKGTKSKKASFYGISASLDEIAIDTSRTLNSTWPTSGDFENPYHGKSREECKRAILSYLNSLKKFAATSNKANQADSEKIARVIKLLKEAK
jgi:hypothetical protein